MQLPRRTTISVLALFSILVVLLAGCGKTPQAEPPGAPPPVKLTAAEKNSFDEVTSHLDPGGNLYMYLGTAQWLDGLSHKIGGLRDTLGSLPGVQDEDRQKILRGFDLATNLISASGIEDVSGLGLSSIEYEKGLYRTKMVLHHYPGRGTGFLWTMFGTEPHHLTGMDMLPTTTVFASFGDGDLGQLWSELEKDVPQSGIPGADEALPKFRDAFEQKTGLKLDETLASLGGEYGVIITLDDTKKVTFPYGGDKTLDFPEPGIVLVVKVKDDLIFNRLDELLKNVPFQVSQTNTDTLKMRTVAVPLPLAIRLRPSIARSGDYLFVATSDALIQQVLAVQSGKQPSIKSTEEFKQLADGLPDQGNRFSYVSKRFGQTWIDVQNQMADQAEDKQAAQAEIMRKFASLNPPQSALFIAANTSEGWMVTGNGNSDGAKLVLAPMVVVPVVAAGIAIPSFIKARDRAQSMACLNNLRQIQAAKNQWALEQGKTSQDTPTWQDLKPYFKNGKIPKCPRGGEYELNAVGVDATCSVHGDALDKSN